MANEAIWTTLTAVDGTYATDTLASDALSTQVVSLATSDHSNYGQCDVVFEATFASAPTSGKTLDVYAQALDIGGNTDHDSPTPDATFEGRYVGLAELDNVSAQTAVAYDVPLGPYGMGFHVKNSSGQTLNGSWVATVVPKTLKPAS